LSYCLAGLSGRAGDDAAHLLGITAAGAITSLLFAAKAAAIFIPMPDTTGATPAAEQERPTGFQAAAEAEAEAATRNVGLAVAALAAFASLAITKHNPAEFGHMMAIPAGLAWSVLGWLVAKDWKASGVPGCFLLTPMVAGALSANLGVMWHCKLAGVDYVTAMHNYLGQVRSDADETLWAHAQHTPARMISGSAPCAHRQTLSVLLGGEARLRTSGFLGRPALHCFGCLVAHRAWVLAMSSCPLWAQP
jgi:hypothetical protein